MDNIGKGIGDAMMGAFLVVAVVCFAGGAALVWLAPKVWAWLKPIIHAFTA